MTMQVKNKPEEFGLSPEEQRFQNGVGEFAKAALAPKVANMDVRGAISPELLRALFAAGYLGIEIPESFGGTGGTFFQNVLLIEEIAKVDPAVAVIIHVHNTLVCNSLLRWGENAQQRDYLQRLASDFLGAFAASEAQAGSDLFSMSTRANEQLDLFVLNGEKKWITNALEAGLFIVFAKTAVDQGPYGVSAFIVPRNTPGLEVGKNENKMGIRASSCCEVHIRNLKIGKQHLLGKKTDGNRIAMDTLNDGKIGVAAQMVGLAQGAFDAALEFAKGREQFGQCIAGFQAVEFKLAELATDITTARLLVYHAARLRDKGVGAKILYRTASMAKYHAAKVAEKVASEAVELFGGRGYISDYPAEKFYRDVKIGKIYEGTSNIQLKTIASTLIGAIKTNA